MNLAQQLAFAPTVEVDAEQQQAEQASRSIINLAYCHLIFKLIKFSGDGLLAEAFYCPAKCSHKLEHSHKYSKMLANSQYYKIDG